jgi:uncharacterized protein (UPF0264 family)
VSIRVHLWFFSFPEMKILISIIDPRECAAFTRWPDYLDVKNPAAGSLGMPPPGFIRAVRAIAGEDVIISAAIGDATDDSGLYSQRAASAANEGADIIKVGLYTFESRRSIIKFLQNIGDALRADGPNKKLVAAMYADRADEALIQKFPRLARDAGAWGCLIDTFDKTRGDLLSHVNLETLKRFTASCRESGVTSALAGGIKPDDLKWLHDVAPDIAGFRSAVASGGRGEVGIDLVKLKDLYSEF